MQTCVRYVYIYYVYLHIHVYTYIYYHIYKYIDSHIYIYAPPKTYLLCSKYVPECLVFLLILSPIVAGHILPQSIAYYFF
jgi:hypothetical protein